MRLKEKLARKFWAERWAGYREREGKTSTVGWFFFFGEVVFFKELKLWSRDFWAGFRRVKRAQRRLNLARWGFLGIFIVNYAFPYFWMLFYLVSLWIFALFMHLCCWFFICFLDLVWKTGEALYHVHYGAFRDIGCTFALNLFVIFFYQHEPIERSWNMAFTGSFLFLFLVLCFLGCLLLFFVGILGAWHYVYYQLMMLEIGFWMLLKLGTQVWKREQAQ